jgi:autotransporter-associated beta strand protein
MKPKKFLRSLFIGGSTLLTVPTALAVNLYWDTDGATSGAGGPSPTATWAAGGTTWSTDSLGATATAAVTTTTDDDLVFAAGTNATGAYAITLADGQNARSLTLEDGLITLSGADGIINLGGIGSITVKNGASATIGGNTSTRIAGTAGLTKQGVGSLTLNGSDVNTFSGGLAINGGTLSLVYQNLITPSDLVGGGNAVALGGGILAITGKSTGSTSQTLGSVTVNSGGGRILGNKNGGTTTTIALGNITATAVGGSLLLGASSTNANLPVITTSATNDATGILGGRSVYFNGNANAGYDFATVTAGTVGSYSGYVPFIATGTDPGTNYALQTTAITGVETQSVNSLKIVGVNLTQTAGTTLTIQSGGLLSASATGSIISGGNLTAGNGSGSYDLVVFQGGTGGGQTTITSNVIDNGENPVNFVKVGPGTTVLNGAKTYTGNTYVNAGILDFGSAAPAGTERNVFVAPGALVKFVSPSTALISRIAQTDEEIGIVITSNSSSAIDFSPTGADLPNAFIAGGWFSNGAKNDNFTGVITPANNTYRIGFPGAAGSFGVSTILDGESNNLIVGGNNVVLTNTNTFGGETLVRTGASLLLANSLALQNSALNLGSATGAITGLFSLSRLQQNVVNDKLVTSATLGGLIGSRNLATAYGGAFGNNAGFLNPVAIRGFTLNPGSGKSYVYTGAIANFARDMPLTKTGAGTQELGGNNTYTGLTTISDGVLGIGHANALGKGGSAGTSAGSTVVGSGATLDLNGVANVMEPIVLNGTGFGGNGALVNQSGTTASIVGGIASLQITAGGTYTGPSPTVTVGGVGTGATATVQMGLSNASLSISGGTGWVIGDLFTTTGGGGSGAVFEVTSVASGAITGVNLVNAGTGYTGAPTAISKLTRTGTATGTLTVAFNASNFAVAGLTLTNSGSGYDATTTATFSDGDATAAVQYSSVTLASNSSIGGSGDIIIDAVVAESGGSYSLTKLGTGIVTLGGVNTYTGATAVEGGTLRITKPYLANASDVTISSSAKLDLQFDESGGEVTDTVNTLTLGGVQQPAGIYGASGSGATVVNNDRFAGPGTLTVLTGPGTSPYATWAGSAAFADDANGDGVDNGLAWFLGAASPTVSALDRLPVPGTPAGFLTLDFDRVNPRSPAKLFVEYGNDLVGWTKLEIPAGSGTIGSDIEVIIDSPGAPALDSVLVKIPTSHAAPGGRLFTRLSASEN